MAGLAPNDIDRRIAARVQAARKAARVTQGDAGRALGVSAAQFQKYEKGSNRLTGGMLQTLADLFGVSVASFFDEPSPARDAELTVEQARAAFEAAGEAYFAAKHRVAPIAGVQVATVLAEAA